jgi:hypothetical protein
MEGINHVQGKWKNKIESLEKEFQSLLEKAAWIEETIEGQEALYLDLL